MGGWHIPLRATKGSNYIAIASRLKLPSSCDCVNDSAPGVYDGIFPEFFHGLYKNGYGLDFGVVYKDLLAGQGKQFYLIYHTQSNTGTPYADPYPNNMPVKIPVSKGTTIMLKTYVSGSSVVAEVWNSSGSSKICSMTVKLTSGATAAFKTGVIINREICMAANRSQMIPSAAFFSDTKFYDSTITTTAYKYELLSLSNSTAKGSADAGSTLNSSRYGWTPTESNGFAVDMASCDWR